MRIRLTELADRDLEAVEAVLQILEAVEHLARHPNLGRGGRVAGTRELVVSRTPYLVVYQVRDATLWVLRVLHGAQQWPPQQ